MKLLLCEAGGTMEGKEKLRKLNELGFLFCSPVARLNAEMEFEESNDPNIKPKHP